MKTKKAAASEHRKEDHGAGGSRRYVLRDTASRYGEGLDFMIDPSLRFADRSGEGRQGTQGSNPFSTGPALRLANHAKPVRPETLTIPKARPVRKDNPFKKAGPRKSSRSSGPKITLPPEFVEWAELRGFSPADAARFVLAWFTEREKVDKHPKVQYTCANTAWPTNAPKIRKMSP